LSIQMTLGDDRAIESTYVAGALAHRRPDRAGLRITSDT
jgi:hypothetical protein